MVEAPAQLPTDRLSLVVGVTGHRDIAADDEGPLRAAFGTVLDELARICPHTPVLVLSGLAAGADSLAAEEAAARRIPVIACLPMPLAEYEKDFAPDELVRFRKLLAMSARVTVTSSTREHGYEATGLYITQYSHVLVAFWDGYSSRGKGGTADVVNTRLTGKVGSGEDLASVPYLPDLGPVYQIVTPRISSAPPSKPFTIKRTFPKRFYNDKTSEPDFFAILGRMDLYSSDLAKTAAVTESQDPLDAIMERTDATANRLQDRTKFFQRFLFACAFIAAATQIIVDILPYYKVIGLAVAFGAYWIARKYDFENRYQDYRAMAEGLRVQSAWYCAGISNHFADRSYLRMQEGELQWIRMAMRSWCLVLCPERATSDAFCNNPKTRGWVRSQWRYYYRASRREHVVSQILSRMARGTLFVGSIVTFASAVIFFGPWTGLHRIAGALLSVPLALAAMFAALIDHYLERQSVEVNARRYERMLRVFDKARRELYAARGDDHDSANIILALGRVALVEHAEWLIMRRDRPIRVVSV